MPPKSFGMAGMATDWGSAINRTPKRFGRCHKPGSRPRAPGGSWSKGPGRQTKIWERCDSEVLRQSNKTLLPGSGGSLRFRRPPHLKSAQPVKTQSCSGNATALVELESFKRPNASPMSCVQGPVAFGRTSTARASAGWPGSPPVRLAAHPGKGPATQGLAV